MHSVHMSQHLDDPEVDVSGMTSEVGAESIVTVQAPTHRTRAKTREATLLQTRAAG